MPIGVIINCLSVLLGGVLGFLLKSKISKNIKEALPNVFGISALCMGITLLIQVKSLSAIVLALILGTIIGEALYLYDRVGDFSNKINVMIQNKTNNQSDGEFDTAFFMSAVVLFCASGSGIFGALNEGFTGDSTILIVKSILDFFTAMIFATSLGIIVSSISIIQLIIYLTLFFAASLIMPLVNADMILDFKACGGMITVAVGFNILKMKSIKVLNLVPALIIVFPISYAWMTFIG